MHRLRLPVKTFSFSLYTEQICLQLRLSSAVSLALGGPLNSGTPGLCLPCLPNCYATARWAATAELSHKIDAFLKRTRCHGFSANIITVSGLLHNVARDFFNEIQWHGHCLNVALADAGNSSQSLHPSTFLVVPLSFSSASLLTILFKFL